MLNPATRLRRALSLGIIVAAVAAGSPLGAQEPEAAAPNYALAAQWTSQKVSKLVFDTTVTPRWLETSDRFWYAYPTREGRRFVLVDPIVEVQLTTDGEEHYSYARSAREIQQLREQDTAKLRVESPGRTDWLRLAGAALVSPRSAG
ncbi:MAG: hypothetical protein ACT4QD_21450 [Acidobacteriota bacterium]